MENFLNIVWDNFYTVVLLLTGKLDAILTPLHTKFGPGVVIILLAVVTVFITKFLKKKFRTKRHIQLEEDFHYWFGVREEAMKCEDYEKGKRMARNIDQSKLNRAYYDYFFEGLLLSLANTYLPVLMVMSYVNKFYRPERLVEITGQDYVLMFGSSKGEPVLIGSIFFYLIALFSTYIIWSMTKKILLRMKIAKIEKCMLQSSKGEVQSNSN